MLKGKRQETHGVGVRQGPALEPYEGLEQPLRCVPKVTVAWILVTSGATVIRVRGKHTDVRGT